MITSNRNTVASERICWAGLNWTVTAESQFACFDEAYEIAASGSVGNGCPATCQAACETDWDDQLYFENGCAFDQQRNGYWTGDVECQCKEPIL
jgi:hypothetical protein